MSKPFDLKFIPFSQLHISKLNMRHSETAPEIDDILPSVKERGIRQPLSCGAKAALRRNLNMESLQDAADGSV